MDSQPQLSIVMVSFNQAQFLEEAIVSVLNQDYPNIEFIMMDGGSTDGSVDIVERYRGKFSYCNIGPDGGAPAALNAGFAQATSNYFAYLNSDDVLLPHAVSTWMETFAKNGADIVYGDIAIIDHEGNPSTLPERRVTVFKATPFSLRRMAAGGCTIPQQASAWTRHTHEVTGGFVEINGSSWDGEYYVDAAIAGLRFQHIPQVLAQFRVHNDSISGTGKFENIRKVDHARMRAKWREAGFDLSPIEKFLLVKTGQSIRAWRYLTGS